MDRLEKLPDWAAGRNVAIHTCDKMGRSDTGVLGAQLRLDVRMNRRVIGPWLRRSQILIGMCFLIPILGRAENVAVTFDDLPLNGELASNTTRVSVAKDVLAVLKKYRAPLIYGFVNAKR